MTLTPGQTFYEGPNDVHFVGRNASKTKPAQFVVFFVKDKGAPVLVPTNRTESRPASRFPPTALVRSRDQTGPARSYNWATEATPSPLKGCDPEDLAHILQSVDGNECILVSTFPFSDRRPPRRSSRTHHFNFRFGHPT